MSEEVKMKINTGLFVFAVGALASFIFQWATIRATLADISKKVDEIAATTRADHDTLINLSARVRQLEK